MKRHCKNLTYIYGTEVNLKEIYKDITKNISSEDKLTVDIRNIKRMPKKLNDIQTGHIKINGVNHTIWREEKTGKETDGGYDIVKTIPLSDKDKSDLIAKYGAITPYEWQLKNYGTKWTDDYYETDIQKIFYIDKKSSLDDLTVHESKMYKKYQCEWFLELTYITDWEEPQLLLNHIAKKYNVEIQNTGTINRHSRYYGESEDKSKYPKTDKEIENFKKSLSDRANAIANAVSSLKKEVSI